jgi:nucleotidyltransferase/DNA polymerase involved in DNA repair
VNTRAILHVDMDAFYASVEQRDRPEWKGKPVIVGAGPHERGVVAAASYEARRFGVRSAMPSRTAYRLCPHGLFVPPDFERYRIASRQVMAIFEDYTPLVQPISIDEAFLDVTGSVKTFAGAIEVARRIKDDIRNQTRLTGSVGVAPNKFLAKLASDLNKPDGLTVITEEEKVSRLAPLPVAKIWGVGAVTEKRLLDRGLPTIGDLQRCPIASLERWFGTSMAGHLHALAFGNDDREVHTGDETKSISSEHTFSEDTGNLEQIRRCLLEQAEEVGMRLRREHLAARTVQLKLRYADFTTLTRRRTLPEPTQDETVLFRVAEELVQAQGLRGKQVRLIGVGGMNLVPPGRQLELFDRRAEKRDRVNQALDSLRAKLGPDVVRRGSLLG